MNDYEEILISFFSFIQVLQKMTERRKNSQLLKMTANYIVKSSYNLCMIYVIQDF